MLGKRLVTETIYEKLQRQITVNSLTECWEWTGARDKDGYGVISVPRPKHRNTAHRVSWRIFNHAEIPKGLLVCHHCDNPPCCNPKHLFLGTASDNFKDCIKKGRYPIRKGEQSPMSKLNNAKVTEMRALWKQGISQPELAKRYGVKPNTVSQILSGKLWRHIS